jgi:hypothetical protein
MRCWQGPVLRDRRADRYSKTAADHHRRPPTLAQSAVPRLCPGSRRYRGWPAQRRRPRLDRHAGSRPRGMGTGEEEHLYRQFGQPYLDYVHGTHRW